MPSRAAHVAESYPRLTSGSFTVAKKPKWRTETLPVNFHFWKVFKHLGFSFFSLSLSLVMGIATLEEKFINPVPNLERGLTKLRILRAVVRLPAQFPTVITRSGAILPISNGGEMQLTLAHPARNKQ